MLNVDEKIELWRQELLQTQSMSVADVEELVDHLAQTVFDLCASGLTKEEAYWVARSRLGDVQILQVEFQKVNQRLVWRQRLLWLLSGYFLFASIPPLVKLLATPIHVYDLNWMLGSGSWLFGEGYQIPYLLFFGVIALATIVLINLIGPNKRFSVQNYGGRKSLTWLVLGSAFIVFAQGIPFLFFSRFLPIGTMGNIAASGAMFGVLWQFLLAISLIMMLYIRNRENRTLLTT